MLVYDTGPGSTCYLWVQLATQDDILEREDDARAFLLGDPPEANFDVVARATMRQFYLAMQADFPPPQEFSGPLEFYGREQVAGRRGLPDADAVDMWNLNDEGDWELVGVQNAGDWKEWAILWSLHLLWRRKAGSAEDPLLARSEGYRLDAERAWKMVRVQVDRDYDALPDRQLNIRTPRLRRG
jgi:hypothetical protein